MRARTIVGIAAMLSCLVVQAWAGPARVLDLNGKPVDPLAATPGIIATVLVFTTTDCPISGRYAPEIQRLSALYRSRGIRFVLVFPVPGDRPDVIKAHLSKFAYALPAVRDTAQELVKATGVTVTPEVAVADARGRFVYRGRIDDWYVDFGRDRPAPTTHDLANALDAIVARHARARARRHARSGASSRTWSNEIRLRGRRPLRRDLAKARGMAARAKAGAHRARAPGRLDGRLRTGRDLLAGTSRRSCSTRARHAIAPAVPRRFRSRPYKEVRQRATQIVQVTQSRFMPPMESGAGRGSLRGPASADGRRTRASSRRGPARAPPKATRRPRRRCRRCLPSWLLGKPDLIVTLPKAFTLPALPTDAFRIFAIPLPVTRRTYVRGIEFHPGNARVVHHANIRIDRTGATRALDDADPLPGYDGLMPRSAEYPDGHFLGWTPGQVAPLISPDLAWTLEPGSDLVVQLHLQPSGAVEQVQPVIGLYFSNEAPKRTPTILRLGSQGIDIAPGDPHYVIRDAYTLPVDMDLLAIQPHAHYRAREIRGTAAFPDGSTRLVMHIKDWDFRWQHVYRLETPLALPKGTRLSMEYTYDNSADNIRNPETPPKHVWWGQRSRDEMGDLWFQLLAKNERDRALVTEQISRKMTAEDIIGYETMIKVDPKDCGTPRRRGAAVPRAEPGAGGRASLPGVGGPATGRPRRPSSTSGRPSRSRAGSTKPSSRFDRRWRSGPATRRRTTTWVASCWRRERRGKRLRKCRKPCGWIQRTRRRSSTCRKPTP